MNLEVEIAVLKYGPSVGLKDELVVESVVCSFLITVDFGFEVAGLVVSVDIVLVVDLSDRCFGPKNVLENAVLVELVWC